MEENNKWVGLVILAIVAIIAIVGLVLLFRSSITGNLVAEITIPSANALGLGCIDTDTGVAINLDQSINVVARLCAENGGHLGSLSLSA